MRISRAPLAAGCVGALLACNPQSHGSPPPDPPHDPAPKPPITLGHWTYYGPGQGLSGDVHDVSADEGGNVYVAGGDAVYAKPRTAAQFARFDASNAGLTAACNDAADMMSDFPRKPFWQCPVISVAGAAPGKAVIGFDGFGQEGDGAALWALHTGGADVLRYDPVASTMSKERHVFIASPPHVICHATGEEYATTCPSDDVWWSYGRRLVRRILRIAVNHDASSPMYGDVWFGGNHGTLSTLLANAEARGWVDQTADAGPEYAEARDVWEHLHPAILGIQDEFLVGAGYAISIDPRNGTPWGSNGIRTTSVTGYPDLTDKKWWMSAYLDLWPDSGDPWSGPTNDEVRSISHCPDGTLWVGSITHGLVRIDPGGSPTYLEVPDPAVNGAGALAVACDPRDGSAWIGLANGGLLRSRGGQLQPVQVAGSPELARHPVPSIQIDRWSNPRVVYFAFAPTRDASGAILSPGGVASYDGD